MSIRSNSRPVGWDLSPEFQNILRKNGMQAHIVREGEGYKLFVQGHDSPMLSYALDAKQIQKLTDWGTNFANKTAYNTFVDLVEKDFYLPRNFVHARNANGRVAMGLHGYRIGVGEYGRMPAPGFHPLRHFFGPSFLGWTPRNQDGFHMRRIGPAMFMQPGAPIVPERPDHRMKPGELQNGGYGFYYKGRQSEQVRQEPPKTDVLKELSAVIKPIQTEQRHEGAAIPYKDAVISPVYFSNEKLQQCLNTHGIIINEDAKTLTVQSSRSQQDFIYDLSDVEFKTLTSNSLKDSSMEQRLDLLNGIVGKDFQQPITMDMLNSKQALAIEVRPVVVQELAQSAKKMESIAITPSNKTEQPIGIALPYKELIPSESQFSTQKFNECLVSHGIEIDTVSNSLTLRSSASPQSFTYSLHNEDMQVLQSSSLKDFPVGQRLELLNDVIGREFREPITMDMLNSSEHISIKLRTAVAQDLEYRSQLKSGMSESMDVTDNKKREAIPYDDLIKSRRKFDGEKFEKCLNSHGIQVDKESNRLILTSSQADKTYVYPVSAGDIRNLLHDSLKEIPLDKRIDFLNTTICHDFHDFISKETLNSEEPLSIRTRTSVEQARQQGMLSSVEKGQAIPYRYIVSSPEAFTSKDFKQCLESHGISIDSESSTLTVKSSETKQVLSYHLRPEELEKLQSDSIRLNTVDDRLNLLNFIVGKDFRDPITLDVLNSFEPVGIRLKPIVEKELALSTQQDNGIRVNRVPFVGSSREARPFNDLVKSPEKFSGERFEKCLSSHGIEIDREANRLIVTSSEANRKYDYHLSPEELEKLTSDSLEKSPLERRLDLINITITRDFYDPVTLEALNSEQPLSIRLRSDIDQQHARQAKETDGMTFTLGSFAQQLKEKPISLDAEQSKVSLTEQRQLEVVQTKEQQKDTVQTNSIRLNGNVLYQLNDKKAWYREGGNGEQLNVEDIKVHQAEGKYKMTAVINGQSISHEISQKQFDKFAAIDDYHRLKLFDKVFDEVDMKTIPGKGFNLLAAVAAGATVVGEILSGPKYGPDLYAEQYSRPHVYFKPGVDTPQDLAARAFEAGVHVGERGGGISR